MMLYLAGYSRYGVGKSLDPANPRDSFVLGEGYTKKEILQIVTIRYAMSANSYQKFIPTVIATDVNEKTVASILENIEDLPGAAIEEDTIRVYEDSIYFAHILGYTGKIDKADLEELQKRVVVTGLGAITPLGNTVSETWDGLINGKSGAGPITHFDASTFKTLFACEVKNFDPNQIMDRKEVRKCDRYSLLAIGAAKQAVEDTGMDLENEDKNRIGVIFAAGIGGIKTFPL